MTPERHLELLNKVCLKNRDAIDFIQRIGKVFRTWDNVWDGDKPYTKEDLDDNFAELAFGLNDNSFFRRYRAILTAQIFIAWNAWKDSNVWIESGDRHENVCAWIIRDYCNEIVMLCAYLVGGVKHTRRVSLEIRKEYLIELVEGGDYGNVQ